MFDSLTASMCVVVTFISFLVHFYSIEYMSHDPHLPRFMSYLSLFTFFMLILITADNFLQMFVGWEGVGLCSYLLINFWFTRIQANKAAIKAMMLNRIGDFSLLISIFLIFIQYKALDYATVAAVTPLFQTSNIYFLNFKVDALVVISGRYFAVNNSAFQLQNILKLVDIAIWILVLWVPISRARNMLLFLFMGRLTNLILCQDLINNQVEKLKLLMESETNGTDLHCYLLLHRFMNIQRE